jgi:hypothetical protein
VKKVCRFLTNNLADFCTNTYASHLLRTCAQCLAGKRGGLIDNHKCQKSEYLVSVADPGCFFFHPESRIRIRTFSHIPDPDPNIFFLVLVIINKILDPGSEKSRPGSRGSKSIVTGFATLALYVCEIWGLSVELYLPKCTVYPVYGSSVCQGREIGGDHLNIEQSLQV